MSENLLELRQLLQVDELPKLEDIAISDAIKHRFLQGVSQVQQSSPRLIAIAGGPGVGKNYLYETLKAKGSIPKHAVLHDPDLVMEAIPAYQEEKRFDPVSAFARWEKPALQLANEILLHALLANHHIIYLRSFALTDSRVFTQFAKRQGFIFEMHLLTCDINIAMSRVRARELITGRHIPLETVIKRHQIVTNSIPELLPTTDEFYVYENNTDGVAPFLIELQ